MDEGQGLSAHLLPCRDERRRANLLPATCQRIVDDETVARVSDQQDRVFELSGADRSFGRRPGDPSCWGRKSGRGPQNDRGSKAQSGHDLAEWPACQVKSMPAGSAVEKLGERSVVDAPALHH